MGIIMETVATAMTFTDELCGDIRAGKKAEAYDLVLHTSAGCAIVASFFE